MQTSGRGAPHSPIEATLQALPSIINKSISVWTRSAQWKIATAGGRLFQCTRKNTIHHSPSARIYLDFVLGLLSTLLLSSPPSSSSHMPCPFNFQASTHRAPLRYSGLSRPMPNRIKPVLCPSKHMLCLSVQTQRHALRSLLSPLWSKSSIKLTFVFRISAASMRMTRSVRTTWRSSPDLRDPSRKQETPFTFQACLIH